MMKNLVTSGVLAITLAGAVSAAELHYPSNDDLRQLRQLDAIKPSPDGKTLIAEIRDSTADGGKPHVWLVDRAGGAPKRLAPDSKTDDKQDNAAWLPDGKSVVFIDHHEGSDLLARVPVTGGAAQVIKIEHLATGAGEAPQPVSVTRFAVAPDGMLAVVAADPDGVAEKQKKKGKDDAVWVDHEKKPHRLYLVDPASGHVTEAGIEGDVYSASWDAASQHLAVIVNSPENDEPENDLALHVEVRLLDRKSLKATPLPKMPKSTCRILWRADGKGFVFAAGYPEPDKVPDCDSLYTSTADGQDIRPISKDFPGEIEAGDLVLDHSNGHAVTTAKIGMKSQIVSFDPDAASYAVLPGAAPVIEHLSTNAAQTVWSYAGAGAPVLRSGFATASLQQPATAVAALSMIPTGWKGAASTTIQWTQGGLTIEGLLYLPDQAQHGKVPLVVNIHGGPLGQFTDTYYPIVNLLVAQGWAVLQPNIRGSSGYGETFKTADRNDLGGADFQDALAGVDYAVAHYPIDPTRLALIGYSYGGEMAGFAEVKTDRFKAIVSGAPVIDQFSEYGTETSSLYDRWYFGTPFLAYADAWRQSPLAGVAKAKTPFLLLQGEADKTDPEGQSQEMYRALHQMHVPVDLVIYPRESHGGLHKAFYGEVSEEPWHGVDARRRMVEFLAGHLSAAPGPTN